MSLNSSPDWESYATRRGRTARISKILDFIKQRKRLKVAEVLIYGMRTWLLSEYTVRRYLKELADMGYIRIHESPSLEPSEATVEYVEDLAE